MEEDSFAMNGGDGPHSYSQNSKYQGAASDQAKLLLMHSIEETLVIPPANAAWQVFRIADLGCSVGPNTFTSMQTIIDAIKLAYTNAGLGSDQIPEFQVFFNDKTINDFNTLFRALPPNRPYMAVGVPGSFHGRLFPAASMNLLHSAFALPWLTKVPEEVKKVGSHAWNEGRITYAGSSHGVTEAFASQFQRDVEEFFEVRSKEMAEDGLLVILIPCRPDGIVASEFMLVQVLECLGNVLADMAREGLVKEALVDSFNLPIFFPSTAEVKGLAMKMDCLSIEVAETIHFPSKLRTPEDMRFCTSHLRAVMEEIFHKHFGSEIISTLFQRLPEKLEQFSRTPCFTNAEKLQILLLVVKKKKKDASISEFSMAKVSVD